MIELKCYGIVIEVNEGSGHIKSDLHEVIQSDDGPEDQQSKEEYNSRMDGITSLILAHAIAGIDVSDCRYLQGIEEAVEAAGNN